MDQRTSPRLPSPAEPRAEAATAARWVGRLPAIAGAVTAFLGAAAIEAYIFGIGPVIFAAPFLPPTQPLTALMFVLTGGSLLALNANLPRHQLAAAVGTVLIAALVLAEYLIWRDLGLDTLLFPEDVGLIPSAFPGRPPPITTACFLLLGLALVLTRGDWHLEHRRLHLSALMVAADSSAGRHRGPSLRRSRAVCLRPRRRHLARHGGAPPPGHRRRGRRHSPV